MRGLVLFIAFHLIGHSAPTLQDAYVVGVQLVGTSPLTQAFTVTSGTDTCMFVGVVIDTNADRNPTVTWNGTPMVLVGEEVGSATANHTALFKLVNPATGTHDVVVSDDFFDVSNFIIGIISVYSGVDQTTPTDTPVTAAAATVTSISSNVSSATGDLVIDVGGINGQSTGMTAGAGQTSRANGNAGSAAGTDYVMSEEAGSATTTMSWSWTGSSSRTGHVSVNVNASSAPPSDRRRVVLIQ